MTPGGDAPVASSDPGGDPLFAVCVNCRHEGNHTKILYPTLLRHDNATLPQLAVPFLEEGW